MQIYVRRPLLVLLSSLSLMASGLSAQTIPAASHPATSLTSSSVARLSTAYGHLPLAFEPNRGQTGPDVQFLSRTPNATLYLSGADAVLQTSTFHKNDAHAPNPGLVTLTGTASVRMHLAGAATSPATVPEVLLPGATNYLTGNDRAKWQTSVPNYARVRLAGVYPGIDLTYYGNQGRLEYDFVVAPHADPSKVRLQFQGTQARLSSNGDLTLPMAGHDLSFAKPVVYQTIEGKRVPVQSSFQIAANRDVTFHLGKYDHARELVIDPRLVYLGTLGTGQNYNNNSQIVVDSTGALYFIGTTQSPYFPVTANAYQKVCGPAKGSAANAGVVYCPAMNNGSTAAYVSKISADGGTLLYSTYLSGHSGTEGGSSIAVDSTGIAYLLGETASNDFPITSDAYQSMCLPGQPPGFEPNPVPPTSQCDNFANGGGTEYTINGPVAFMAKLSADGSSLLYSSFLGGSLPAYTAFTGLDSSGNWYVYGQTTLLQQSNLYGSGGGDVQFPFTSTGYQTVANPSATVNVGSFMDKFSNDGKTLLYGTYFGDITNDVNVLSTSFAVGQKGVVFIGGFSQAAALPTTSGSLKQNCTAVSSNVAYCTTYDGYVAAIDTTASGSASLKYSTRLGGSTAQGSNTPNNEVLGLVANSSNDVVATGYTFDPDFPVTSGAYSTVCGSLNTGDGLCNSAFVSALNPTGSALLASTFLGGTAGSSTGYSVALDSQSRIYANGITSYYGTGFPQVNPIQPYSGNQELYIATLSPDMSSLLFGTTFTNPSDTLGSGANVTQAGFAVSGSGNIYFAGNTVDANFSPTPGTYNSQSPNCCGANHTFFGEISNVLLANSTTAVTLSSGTVTTGGSVKVTVKVTGSSGTPTGTASLYLDGVLVGPLTLTNGSASTTAPLTNVSKGSHKIGAVYNGDSTYGNSTAIAALTVTPYATSVTVSATPTSVYAGQDVTLSATVKRTASSGTPTGSVTFYGDGVAVATVPLNGSGVAKFTASTAGFAAGTYNVTAKYTADSLDAASTSAVTTVTLKALNATTTTLAATPNPVTPPAKETLTATVKRNPGGPSGTPAGAVTFSVGTTVLGKVNVNSNGVATLTAPTSGIGAGNYPAVAKYAGDSNGDAASTSNTVTIVVQ